MRFLAVAFTAIGLLFVAPMLANACNFAVAAPVCVQSYAVAPVAVQAYAVAPVAVRAYAAPVMVQNAYSARAVASAYAAPVAVRARGRSVARSKSVVRRGGIFGRRSRSRSVAVSVF